MKIITWDECDTPGPMAEALAEQNVPHRLDQGHEGWVFSVLPRDWIFVKAIAAEADFRIEGVECEVEPEHFGS